jgi:hypothetical protein
VNYSYPLLRSLDPHHQRIGYLGALATVSARGLDSAEALTARFQELLFDKVHRDDARFERLLSRIPRERRDDMTKRMNRAPEDDPAAILSDADGDTGWLWISEFWLHDACMPSPLGHLGQRQVHRTIDLARWVGILQPTYELSDTGYVLQKLLLEANKPEDELFNVLNPRPRPSMPLLYIRLLLASEMLFPFLVHVFASRDASTSPMSTRGEHGLLVAAVEAMLAAIGEPSDPADMLAAREVSEFLQSLRRTLSTEENYLRPRMEILVDVGLVGRKSASKKSSDFAWIVTDETRRLADEWRRLATVPNAIPTYLEEQFFASMGRVFEVPLTTTQTLEERLLWFVRAFAHVGRDFGFTPGRTVALVACLLAWEAGTALEIRQVFDAVYEAARSRWSGHLHFSGGSRFDREFLIRVDEAALRALEQHVSITAAR